MAVSDAALRAVAANAVRHVREADQHYKAGRYPSATASAVLSIEESGKLGFLAGTDSAPRIKGYMKHGLHATLFFALLEVITPSNVASEWGAMLRDGNTSDLTLQQQQAIGAYPEVANFVRRVQAGELRDSKLRVEAWAAAMTAKERDDGTLKRRMSQFTNGLQPLRLNATYVDVSESGDISTEPDLNDAGLPQALCASAAGLLVVVLGLAAMEREKFDVRTLVETLPDDLTGFDELCRTFPMLSRITTARRGAIRRLSRRVRAKSQSG
jgi:hypothetical protein